MPNDGLSVIITAYRSGRFISDCLDSVYGSLAALRVPWELVIGVDACQDTLEAVMAYPLAANTSVYWFAQNCGTYVVSNTLAGLARHPTLVRFDSDDIMLPAFADYLSLDVVPGSIMRMPYRSFVEVAGRRRLRGTGKIDHTCGVVAIAPGVLGRLGGWRNWRCAADTDLMYRAKMAGLEVWKLPPRQGPAMLRRRHEGALTQSADTGGRSALRQGYKQIMWATTDPYVEPVVAACHRVA